MSARALTMTPAAVATPRRAGPALPARGVATPALAPFAVAPRRPIAVVAASPKRSGSDLASLAADVENTQPTTPAPAAKPSLTDRAAAAARVTVASALALALMATPALAAGSGGRVGGAGGFSAARSMPSYSAPRSSYGGGGGARFDSRTAPPLRVAPRSLNGVGLGWGLVPFGGYGFGYGYPAPVVVGGGGGGGLGDLLIFGLFAAVAVSIISSFLNNREGEDESGAGAGYGRVTVAKLQVGLLGSARSLQRDLDRIAGKADTSSPSGLHFVLQETVLALLRNPEYAIYGSSATRNTRSLAAGEAAFNEASLEERGKMAEETLVNVGGRSRAGAYSKGGSSGNAPDDDELVVVTVLVAARGGLSLPKVTSASELRTALNRLGAVPADDVLAVEVLWTPQDPRDKYFRSDALADYPTLNVL